MNWILEKSDLFQFHTHLEQVLKPIREDTSQFKWLLSDLEFISDSDDIPINFEQNYFILDKDDFETLLSHDIQFIWGAILGFRENADICFNPDMLPYVEGNDLIWEEGNIQIPGAIIEIDCFDSSATIIKFSDETLSKKFHDFYPGCKPLERSKN